MLRSQNDKLNHIGRQLVSGLASPSVTSASHNRQPSTGAQAKTSGAASPKIDTALLGEFKTRRIAFCHSRLNNPMSYRCTEVKEQLQSALRRLESETKSRLAAEEVTTLGHHGSNRTVSICFHSAIFRMTSRPRVMRIVRWNDLSRSTRQPRWRSPRHTRQDPPYRTGKLDLLSRY